MKCPPTLHGDETGLLKEVHYQEADGAGKIKKTFGKQNRIEGIQKLLVLHENQVVIATKNSALKVWDGVSLKPVVKTLAGGQIKGLCGSSDRIITGTQIGKIEIRNWPNGEITGSFQVDNPIEAASLCPTSSNRLAVGGKEHDLRIWDIETRSIVFRAKNVSNDSLDMAIPVWITDVCWTTSASLIMTCTAYNQIRGYDLRQKKPIKDIHLSPPNDEINRHLNCIVSTPDDCAIVADIFGQVSLVDVFNTGKRITCFKGPKGSVRSLSIDQDSRKLACAGLDRFIRIFDLDSHRQIGRCYVKQKVNSVAFGAVLYEKEVEKQDNDEDLDLDWGDDDDNKEDNDVEDEDEDDDLDEEEGDEEDKPKKRRKAT